MSPGKSLEDMYAKVMKKKQQRDTMNEEEPGIGSSSNSFTLDPAASNIAAVPKARRKLSLIEQNRASWSSHDPVEIRKRETTVGVVSSSSTNDNSEFDDGYEAVMNVSQVKRVSAPPIDANYETLRPLHHSNTTGVTRNGIDAVPIYSMPFKHRQVGLLK